MGLKEVTVSTTRKIFGFFGAVWGMSFLLALGKPEPDPIVTVYGMLFSVGGWGVAFWMLGRGAVACLLIAISAFGMRYLPGANILWLGTLIGGSVAWYKYKPFASSKALVSQERV